MKELLSPFQELHYTASLSEVAREKASDAHLAAIVEHAADAIISVDLHGLIISWNNAAERLFGYTASEMVGTPLAPIVPVERSHGERYVAEELRFGNTVEQYETQWKRKDGTLVDVCLTVSPVKTKSGTITGFSTIARDITERKKLEREQAMWYWEQEALRQADFQMFSSVDPLTVLNIVSGRAKTLVEADLSAIVGFDDSGRSMWLAAKGNLHPLPESSLNGSLKHRLFLEKKPIVFDAGDPDLPKEELKFLTAEQISSCVIVPLGDGQPMVGVLLVGFRRKTSMNNWTLTLLTNLAEHASIAILNAKAHDDIRKHEEALQVLSSAKIEIQEDERRRIARELHDGLGQILSVIKFNIEILEDDLILDDPLEKRWKEIKNLLDSAMTETKEISYKLMPPVLQDFGLIPALQSLCDQTASPGHRAVSFTSRDCNTRFPSSVEISLYRIAQEALNNIIKHANAARVAVDITSNTTDVTLTVRDNGKGFDLSKVVKRSIGLMTMRERAELLKGSLTIDSVVGQGTVVTVKIPLLAGHEKDPNSPC